MNKRLAVAGMLTILLPGLCSAQDAAAQVAKAETKAEKTEAAKPAVKADAKADSAEAALPKSSDDASWFSEKLKVIKTRINRKMQSASVRNSAVAAVRGEKTNVDALEPDWKGGEEEKTAVAAEKERKAVTSAFEKIVAGKNAEGAAELKKFLSDYPASSYTEIVKEALAKVQPASGTPVKTEEKPATK